MTNATDKRKRQFYAARLLLNQLYSHYLSTHDLNREESSTFTDTKESSTFTDTKESSTFTDTKESSTFPYRFVGTENKIHSFNISHSDNWVAVAISDGNSGADIGVDIQTLKRNWTPAKAGFFCSEAQVKKGFHLDKPENYFTQLWSQKEAYYKATQKKFVATSFENDDNLSSKCFSDKDTPVFLSLYCVGDYTLHFQELNLLI